MADAALDEDIERTVCVDAPQQFDRIRQPYLGVEHPVVLALKKIVGRDICEPVSTIGRTGRKQLVMRVQHIGARQVGILRQRPLRWVKPVQDTPWALLTVVNHRAPGIDGAHCAQKVEYGIEPVCTANGRGHAGQCADQGGVQRQAEL